MGSCYDSEMSMFGTIRSPKTWKGPKTSFVLMIFTGEMFAQSHSICCSQTIHIWASVLHRWISPNVALLMLMRFIKPGLPLLHKAILSLNNQTIFNKINFSRRNVGGLHCVNFTLFNNDPPTLSTFSVALWACFTLSLGVLDNLKPTDLNQTSFPWIQFEKCAGVCGSALTGWNLT